MSTRKTDVPEPTAKQIAYSRTAAAHLAIRLLNDAADALMTGHDMPAPRLPRASPTDDAITARSLQIIATALENHVRDINK